MKQDPDSLYAPAEVSRVVIINLKYLLFFFFKLIEFDQLNLIFTNFSRKGAPDILCLIH